MMELINRQALLDAYDAAHKGPPGRARKLIQEAPTVEAEPVRHGHWNKRKGLHFVMRCDDYGNPICKERKEHTIYLCSECERRTMIKSAYCPACGCKMDKVSE